MARSTLARMASLTDRSPLRAREAVPSDTPALRATSLMVGRSALVIRRMKRFIDFMPWALPILAPVPTKGEPRPGEHGSSGRRCAWRGLPRTARVGAAGLLPVSLWILGRPPGHDRKTPPPF